MIKIEFFNTKIKNKNKSKWYERLFFINRNINTDNIFYFNRLGINDTLEAGRSLTIGVDYKKEKLDEINKYFEFKIASSFRDKEEKFISKSTLNRKHSNLFGTLTNSFSENFQIDYNFSIDNDYNTLEYSQINTKLNYNNFVTELNFLKEKWWNWKWQFYKFKFKLWIRSK